MNDDPTLPMITRRGSAGHIRLNRPRSINALQLKDIHVIAAALENWCEDPSIALVTLSGTGERGFCAGGDIRAWFPDFAKSEPVDPTRFWREEYDLNMAIAAYPKPIVSFMDGICMGGGIGLGAHASHRVVTERSRLGMPEVAIGFLPDVGGTHLMSCAPGELGTWLALTASQVTGGEAVAVGLADYLVPSDVVPEVISDLEAASNALQIEERIDAVARSVDADRKRLTEARTWIDPAFASNKVETILSALRNRPEEAAAAAAIAIRQHSPTSLKLTLRALRLARERGDLADAIELEFRLAKFFLRHPDLREGIRAKIVDKDNSPNWHPARVEDVDDTECDPLFAVLS